MTKLTIIHTRGDGSHNYDIINDDLSLRWTMYIEKAKKELTLRFIY